MLKENLNLKYWNNFYKKKNLVIQPSKFATYCQKVLKDYKGIVYDIGCGNGRDVIFFNKKKIYCIGIDKSPQAIFKSKKKFLPYKNHFKNKNFCKFFFKQLKVANFSIYSRFSLHSISYVNEKKLLDSLINQANLEYLFIESRTLDDELYGIGKRVGKHEFISTHYRRFIDPLILKQKLKKYFNIIYFRKSKGFAKFKKEDPCILRIIAKKKSI